MLSVLPDQVKSPQQPNLLKYVGVLPSQQTNHHGHQVVTRWSPPSNGGQTDHPLTTLLTTLRPPSPMVVRCYAQRNAQRNARHRRRNDHGGHHGGQMGNPK